MEILTPEGVQRPRRRLFCGLRQRLRRKVVVGGAALALTSFTFGPLVMQSCGGGPLVRGNVYLSIGCASTGGLQYRGVLTGFPAKIGFRYSFWVSRNGVQVVAGENGMHFYTDGAGSHWAYPMHYYPPTCSCHWDDFNVQAVAISDDGKYESSFDNQSVTCPG